MAYSRKASGLTISTLVGIIAALLVLASVGLLYAQVRDEVKDTDLAKCRLSIEVAHGLPSKNIEGGLGDYQLELAAVPIECTPIRLNDEDFKKVKTKEAMTRLIAENMKNAWWATGAGRINNVWFDVGWNWFEGQQQLCKPLYIISYSNTDEELFPSRLELLNYIETEKLPELGRTLREYVASSSALQKGYYVALEDGKIKKDVPYAIFVSSSRVSESKLVFAELNQKEKLIFKASKNSPQITLCDQYVNEKTQEGVLS